MHVYVQADLSQQTSMHLHGRRCCKVEVIIQPPGFLCCIYFRTSWEAVSVASRRNLTDNDWMTFERKVATCKSTVLTHVSWLISRFAFCLMLRPQFMDTPSLLLWSCRQHIKYTSRPVSRQEIHAQVDFISDMRGFRVQVHVACMHDMYAYSYMYVYVVIKVPCEAVEGCWHQLLTPICVWSGHVSFQIAHLKINFALNSYSVRDFKIDINETLLSLGSGPIQEATDDGDNVPHDDGKSCFCRHTYE